MTYFAIFNRIAYPLQSVMEFGIEYLDTLDY